MNTPNPLLNLLSDGYAECGPDLPQNGLLLAVSGGPDSMALLHATVQLWPERLDRISVAHVDHGLRREQSRADAEFVAGTAEALEVSCHVLVCDVATALQQDGGSTEEVARRLRYQVLESLADSLGYSSVVCAHHQDDQAETVLHNILRGTGMRGLGGMSRTRALSDSVNLIRPLLSVARDDITRFLRDHELAWRTDDTNASHEFTRNRIRHQLLPLLTDEFNPQIKAGLVRLAEHAREAERQAEQIADRCLEDVVLELQPGVCRLRRERLAAWPVGTVRSMLRLVWHRQAWPQQAMTQRHWQQMAAELRDVSATIRDVPGVSVSATTTIVRLFRMPQQD